VDGEVVETRHYDGDAGVVPAAEAVADIVDHAPRAMARPDERSPRGLTLRPVRT